MDKLSKILTDSEFTSRLALLKAKADVEAEAAKFLAPLNPPDGQRWCQRCSGAGWAPDETGRYRRCDCVAPVDVYADGCPYEFQSVTVESYGARDSQQAAIDKVQAALARGRDVYVYGGVGAGKTRLACAVANTHYRKRNTARIDRVPMLLHQLQPGREGSEIEAALLRVSLAVFDDLAAERDQATDYTRRTLLMLYEERCDRNLRTIFTSNKSLQQLAEMQDDDRLSSRIAGRCDVIRMTTSDQRLARRPK